MSESSDSESSLSSESAVSTESLTKQCFFCGVRSNQCATLVIRDIGKVEVCSECDDILLGYIVETRPGPRFFLAKPWKECSQLPRYVFDDVEEFKEWCEKNEEEEDVYIFGITRTSKFPGKDEWIETGNESYAFEEKVVYWCDDALDWKYIYSLYTEPDCDVVHIRDGETEVELDLPEFFGELKATYEEKHQKMAEEENRSKERVLYLHEVERYCGF